MISFIFLVEYILRWSLPRIPAWRPIDFLVLFVFLWVSEPDHCHHSHLSLSHPQQPIRACNFHTSPASPHGAERAQTPRGPDAHANARRYSRDLRPGYLLKWEMLIDLLSFLPFVFREIEILEVDPAL